MAIEGPLKELSIHDVFQLLDLSRKTGTLRVTSQLRRNDGAIQFESGAVVAAQIRSNPHQLGALLLRAGKITEGELEMADDMQRRGDTRRLGEILVEIGALSPRDLERQIRLQVEEVVFEVMGWQEGHFSFTEGPPTDLATGAPVRIPTEVLLMEAARRTDEWSRIQRQVPHLGVVPVLEPVAEGEGGQLDLLPLEWEVLAMVDGTRDLRGIAQILGRAEFDVAKMVFGLQSAGILSLRDSGAAGRGGEEEKGGGGGGGDERDLQSALARIDLLLEQRSVAQARQEVEKLLATQSGSPLVHLAAATVELAAGRPGEGEAECRRVLGLDPLLALGHRVLGDALVMQGKLAEAADWWRRSLTVGGEDDDPEERNRVTAAADAAQALDAILRARYGG